MEEIPMYLCLKLKERYIEYNKENETKVGFAKYLRILQYSKEDIDAILSVMSKKRKHERSKNRRIQRKRV